MPKTVSDKLKVNSNQKTSQSAGVRPSSAFTIVELLIVIVIIGILAAITIVSYSGITSKANTAALQSDLTNGAKKLNIYYTLYNTYPTMSAPDATTGTICPTNPNTDTQYCLKPSNGNTFTYTLESDQSLGFTLTATKGSTTYAINKATAPKDVTVTTTPITAIGAITGTAQMGQTLTAGAITPAGATVSYQWQSATTSGGTYININGATASTYTPDLASAGKYLKVMVTGTGSYTGTQTSLATSTVIAIDSNWVIVGTQVWAAKNLNVGTMVTGTTTQTNNSTIEKYCYSNIESNCTTYGGLYQWGEAMQYSATEGAQGICPAGSHIPSDNDWKVLEMQLGMTQAQVDATGGRGTDQGTQLKTGGVSGWNGLLAGFRVSDGSFLQLSSTNYTWTSTESGANALGRVLGSSSALVYRDLNYKANGYSVRCLAN